MSKKTAWILIVLLAFLIPIEHKYDKPFRLYSLTLIPEGLEVSKSYGRKLYFYISDLIALLLLFIPVKGFFKNPLWLVWICALISIALSPFSLYPVAYLRLLQLLTPIILFSFISNSKGEKTRFILTAIAAASLIQAAIAIAQYFHQAPLGLRLLGEANKHAVFAIHDGSRWFLDEILGRKSNTSIIMRAAGTFSNANAFGGFMFFSLICTYALAIRHCKIALLIPLQFFALALSYSRSALFAWGLATFCWFGQMFFVKRQGIKLLALIIFFSFSISAALLFKQYFYRGGVISTTALSKGSDQARLFYHGIAFKVLKEAPFFGLGWNQFSERAQSFFPEEAQPSIKSGAPHNIFLFLACETGLISLFFFLIFLSLLFWAWIQSPISLESATFSSILIGFLFIGLCDFYPILFQQGRLMFFLSAALLAAHTRTYPNKKFQSIFRFF